jgi:hypothetical protein
MVRGKTLIVHDVDFLTSTLEAVLPLELLPEDTAIRSSVKIGDHGICKHVKFGLFLVTSLRSVDELPENLICRVALFLSSPNVAIRLKLTSLFKDKFATLVPLPNSSPAEELDGQIERVRLERDVIDLMTDIHSAMKQNREYDLVTDEESTVDLFRTKERYLQNVNMKCHDIAGLPMEFELFLPTVTMCTMFWESLTRYLPRIGTNIQFALHGYQSVIRKGIAYLHDDTDAELIRSTVQHVILEFALPSLTIRDAFFAMFICSFLMRVDEKKCQLGDLEAIVSHVRTELCDVCDPNLSSVLTGDPIDQMKFANIANLFTFMYRLVAEYFGENFESFFPCFRSDSLILQGPGEPLLIHTPNENYPLHMVTQFLTNQNAIDRFFSFSSTDDEKSLEKILSAVSQLTSAWIILHYTTPSRKAVIWLLKILRAFRRSDQDNRFIIFVSSFEMLPDSLLSAKWVAVDDFPRFDYKSINSQHSIKYGPGRILCQCGNLH